MIVPDFYEGNAEPRFLQLRRHGTRLVALKASEGRTYVDGRFSARRRKAIAAGLHWAAYHFARPDLHPDDAGSEAEHFLATVGRLQLRRAGYALDLERGFPELEPAHLEWWCRRFSQLVHHHSGVWPWFYANSDYIQRLRLHEPIGGGLWLANYGPNDGRRHPVAAPHPWHHVLLHQFTSVGSLDGASGHVDLSYHRALF